MDFIIQNFFSIFLFFLFLSLVIELYLNLRQAQAVRRGLEEGVPILFKDKISDADHQKASQYSLAKLKVGSVQLIWSVVVILFWVMFGGINGLNELIQIQSATAPLYVLSLFLVLFIVINSIFNLPFSIYKTFVLEEKFGFNKTTAKTFALDMIKQLFLTLAIVFPLALLILWVLTAWGDYAWIYSWIIWVSFTVFMMWAYPVLLAPIFNKFIPLKDEALKNVIQNLVKKCGFDGNGVFTMDGSKRSSHGNAYIAGLGKKKKIVFFDTLLKYLNSDEVEAVLAHELGHFHYKHIHKNLIFSFIFSFLGFYVLGYLLQSGWLFSAMNVHVPHLANMLLLFLLILPAFTFWITPITNILSRRHEFQADEFATTKSNGESLTTALVKLTKENSGCLSTDPLYVTYHYSHPDMVTRIKHLQAVASSV